MGLEAKGFTAPGPPRLPLGKGSASGDYTPFAIPPVQVSRDHTYIKNGKKSIFSGSFQEEDFKKEFLKGELLKRRL